MIVYHYYNLLFQSTRVSLRAIFTYISSLSLQRERKERKLYSDDWALGDEEIEGHHTFDLEQKIKTDKFDSCFVKDMTDHGK